MLRVVRALGVLLAIRAGAAEPPYNIQTFAGTDYVGDGAAARNALLIQPEGLAVSPDGTVYISDAAMHRIRRIRPDGVMETVAGTGVPGFFGDDGPALKARLSAPYGLALDRAGNLYFADLGNSRIRKISPNGQIATVVGGGTADPITAEGGPATRLALKEPRNVAVDAQGTLYVSDFGAHLVYRVSAGGLVNTLAGTGERGYSGDKSLAVKAQLSYPAGLAVDLSGSVYVGDSGNKRVRKIQGGLITTVTDGGGKPLEFGVPTGVAIDTLNTLYVADRSDVVVAVTSAGAVTQVPLNGGEVAVDQSLRVYTASGHFVKRFDGGIPMSIAGTGLGLYAGDGGPKTEWRFNMPSSVVRDRQGTTFVADTGNGRVRQIDSSGQLKSIASGLELPTGLAIDSVGRVAVSDAKTGAIYRLEPPAKPLMLTRGAEGNPIKQPTGIVFDAQDNLYIADTASNVIRKMTPDGYTSIVAGGGGIDEDGHALVTRLSKPFGVAFDPKGNLWFTEAGSGRVRRLDKSTAQLTTVARTEFKEPRGIDFDRDGNAYVADAGLHRVFKIAPDGKWWPIAGNGDIGIADENGPALAASLWEPSDIFVADDGSVFAADARNGRIRQLTRTTESVEETPPPAPIMQGRISVAHAAFEKSSKFAPGQLVKIRVDGLDTVASADLRLEAAGTPITILSNTAGEMSCVLPANGLSGSVEVVARIREDVRAKTTIEVAPVVPAVFAVAGAASAVNDDSTLNSWMNPAGRSGIVSIFLTGAGANPNPAVDVRIGVLSAEVVYAGPAPGLPGVLQVNARTPGGFAPSGVLPLAVYVEGVKTQDGVTIAVQ